MILRLFQVLNRLEGGADFVLCLMDTKNAGMYSSIKRVSERKHGILTQCITLKSAKKANPQLCGMVLMKINAKLGGIAVKVHWDGLKNSRESYILNHDYYLQSPVAINCTE